MSRRYPIAEAYDERQRDFYGNGRRGARDYDDFDSISRSSTAPPDREYPSRRQPDFLRDDYGRTSAGALVPAGDRARDPYDRAPPRPQPRGGRDDYERDEFTFRHDERESRPPPPSRGRPRSSSVDKTEVVIRRQEQESRPPPRRPDFDRDAFVIRRGEGRRPSPPSRGGDYERDEFRFRHSEADLGRKEVEKDEFVYRHTDVSPSPPRPRRERSLPPRRERSMPPPRGDLLAREREEFIYRHRHSPSPPPPPPPEPRTEKEEIIIRRTERSPTPPPPPPPPPPMPEPIIRPPIHQEIITHHRHIDHGVERARSPTPPPPPPSPPREEKLEIAIRRRGSRNFTDENIIYEREVTERKEREKDMQVSRRRSSSAPRQRNNYDDDIQAEADFYNRKAMERAYPGEGYNGATRDWTIVDVPPGTKRVQMDGMGGGGQEITWQRYNGVRRSKFIADDEVYATDFGLPAPTRDPGVPPLPGPPKPRPREMWTEITKDLVLKEALDARGYEYEETEYFFYVMEYLRYEDVLRLVEISEDIRRDRRTRIREIQWEREELENRRRLPPPTYDDRYFERDVVYDSRRTRYR
ncbi:hypothetical protein BDY21DRAFT_116703 [Lineolata rhizophorae]|uniref:DUF8035 domain-containing protein n=1 Tax=Lineolata rhizophorae TaxID=578093 RepID=A0A6A6NR61_9PEZI|nr:hypothetical protein BDY21DRAFT_116703 [Lineolata rhizophorae]